MSFGETPRSIAKRLQIELEHRYRSDRRISSATLRHIVETLYDASLRTEENRRLEVHVVYMPRNLYDEASIEGRPRHQWRCMALARPLQFDVTELVKLALATDPRSSALAISDDNGELSIWGIVDQQGGLNDFLNFDAVQRGERPGIFQASILGPANIAVYYQYEKLVELRLDKIVTNTIDVFAYGPIRTAFKEPIRRFLAGVTIASPPDTKALVAEYEPELTLQWIGAICRILRRIQRFRHGGALLLTNTQSLSDLAINYDLHYDRLPVALEKEAAERLVVEAGMRIAQQYPAEAAISIHRYKEHVDAQNKLVAASAEVQGAIWFMSLLSRVDGCVVLTPELVVRGFGAEITCSDVPPEVLLSRTPQAEEDVIPLDYSRFGTRHRSMMRYVWKHPYSVGFVISQDGAIRVMARVRAKLIVWDNIKLEHEIRRRRSHGAA